VGRAEAAFARLAVLDLPPDALATWLADPNAT